VAVVIVALFSGELKEISMDKIRRINRRRIHHRL
jgi:hypothetical protein